MKNEPTSIPNRLFLEWFPLFMLLLASLPDIAIAAAVNISCPEKFEEGDVSIVKCVIDTIALERQYGCESSSDMINFTVNPRTSRATPCSVQFPHNHFCLTLKSYPGLCQCIHAEENVYTFQYFFKASDANMDAEIFCSIGCYKSSQYFLIESNRCKFFKMRPYQSTETPKSNNSPGGEDDDNVVILEMLKRQQEHLLADFDSLKSQLTSVQDTVKKAVADIDDLQTRISSLEASNKELKGESQKAISAMKDMEERMKECVKAKNWE